MNLEKDKLAAKPLRPMTTNAETEGYGSLVSNILSNNNVSPRKETK